MKDETINALIRYVAHVDTAILSVRDNGPGADLTPLFKARDELVDALLNESVEKKP